MQADSTSTVEKAIDLLFHLHAERSPCGVTSIGRALDMPKSSVHRLLKALGRRGLVEQDARGHYRPGVALVALGLGVLESEPVVAAARPVLEQHAEDLGETFFLVSARARQLVVLAKAEGPGFLRAAPRVGASVPVHATAVGKLYLAFASDTVDATDRHERFTARTLGERDLAAAVRTARERGWARNRDEWIPGLSVSAAPVFLGRRLVAAVALAGVTPRLDELGDQAGEQVCIAAASIAARLEGPGDAQGRVFAAEGASQ